jgi:multiple sugar transport system substrate-binding protein
MRLVKNRAFIFGLALLFIVSFAQAIFAEGQKEEGQVTLKLWSMQQSDKRIIENQNSVIAEFQKQHPNIKVNLEVTPYNAYRDKLLVAAKGGNPPDISAVDQIWNPEFAAAGLIIPLDEYLNDSPVKEEQFFSGAWDSAVYKNQVWGIPLDVGAWEFLYYNVDRFNEVGVTPPNTWNEWYNIGKKLTRDTNNDGEVDQWGLYLLGAKGEIVVVFTDSLIFSNGGQIVSDDGTEGMLDSPEVIEAMKFYKKLTDIAPPGVPDADQTESSNYFATGKVAMETIGEWEQDTIESRAPDLNWDMAAMPAPEKGDTFHACFGGWNFVIYKNSEHKDAAWEFVEFASSQEMNFNMASLTPAHLDAAEQYLNKFKKRPDIIFETMENAYARPISPIYPQISEIQQDMAQDILLGEGVEASCKKANERLNDLLAGE